MLSTQVFNDVFEAAGTKELTAKEVITRFSEKVGLLELVVLYVGLSIGQRDPAEGGRWIEEAFGTLIQKYAWRRCFFRQIMDGEYKLTHPVLLDDPVTLEVKDKLVRLPEAFVPRVTEKILRAMPELPENGMEEFRRSLEEAYPEDMKKLNDILALIKIEGGE